MKLDVLTEVNQLSWKLDRIVRDLEVVNSGEKSVVKITNEKGCIAEVKFDLMNALDIAKEGLFKEHDEVVSRLMELGVDVEK